MDEGNNRDNPAVTYRANTTGVDWDALRKDLIDDNFHNGRTTRQLADSFAGSAVCVMAWHNKAKNAPRCIGNARALSDGVGNAYVLDVWTQSSYRGQGIGKELMRRLLDQLPGQHVYLQTDDAVEFYQQLGFKPQPEGLFKIVGNYLNQPSG